MLHRDGCHVGKRVQDGSVGTHESSSDRCGRYVLSEGGDEDGLDGMQTVRRLVGDDEAGIDLIGSEELDPFGPDVLVRHFLKTPKPMAVACGRFRAPALPEALASRASLPESSRRCRHPSEGEFTVYSAACPAFTESLAD